MSPKYGDMHYTEVTSGVNDELVPFLQVRTFGTLNGEDIILLGQLTPDDIRKHALDLLAAAEAAESDSLIITELTESIGVTLDVAGQFLVNLRNRRDNES